MIAAEAGGCALLLGTVLVAAGIAKSCRPGAFAAAMDRLWPAPLPFRATLTRAAAPAVGALEIGIGGGLLRSPRWAVPLAASTLALFVGFGLVVATAIRKQTGCGCFTARSDDVATPADGVRAVASGIVAAGLLAAAATGRAASPWSGGALLVALALVAVIGALSVAAGRHARGLRRVRGPAESLRLSGGERAAALRALEATPSVRALRAHLGTRAAALDLQRSAVGAPAGPGWLVVTPPPLRGLRVRMSVPWDGAPAGDPVISAVIDGAPVLVAGGVVHPAGVS